MKKVISYVLCAVLLLATFGLSACGKEASAPQTGTIKIGGDKMQLSSDFAFFETTQWGMTKEEVQKALGISDSRFLYGKYEQGQYYVEDCSYLGVPCEVSFNFFQESHSVPDGGLASIEIFFDKQYVPTFDTALSEYYDSKTENEFGIGWRATEKFSDHFKTEQEYLDFTMYFQKRIVQAAYIYNPPTVPSYFNYFSKDSSGVRPLMRDRLDDRAFNSARMYVFDMEDAPYAQLIFENHEYAYMQDFNATKGELPEPTKPVFAKKKAKDIPTFFGCPWGSSREEALSFFGFQEEDFVSNQAGASRDATTYINGSSNFIVVRDKKLFGVDTEITLCFGDNSAIVDGLYSVSVDVHKASEETFHLLNNQFKSWLNVPNEQVFLPGFDGAWYPPFGNASLYYTKAEWEVLKKNYETTFADDRMSEVTLPLIQSALPDFQIISGSFSTHSDTDAKEGETCYTFRLNAPLATALKTIQKQQ